MFDDETQGEVRGTESPHVASASDVARSRGREWSAQQEEYAQGDDQRNAALTPPPALRTPVSATTLALLAAPGAPDDDDSWLKRKAKLVFVRMFIGGLPWTLIPPLVVLAVPLFIAVVFIVALAMSTSMSAPAAAPNLVNNASADDRGGLISDSLLTDKELQAFAREVDQYDPEVRQCLGDVPPVQKAATPKTLVTPEEAQRRVDEENAKRQQVKAAFEANPPTTKQEQQRRKVEVQREQERRRRWEQEQKGLQVGKPMVSAGEQVMENGHVKKGYTSIVNTIPKGTPFPAAHAYLVAALAGGTTGWEHFVQVVEPKVPGGLGGISQRNERLVLALLFEQGFDAAPYDRAATSLLIPRLADETVTVKGGDMDTAFKPFIACFDQGGDNKRKGT